MSEIGELKVLALELSADLGRMGYPTKEKDVLPHMEREHWLIMEAFRKARSVPTEERTTLEAISGRLNGIANAMASVAVYPNAAQLEHWRKAVEEAYDMARGVRGPHSP